MSNVIDLPTERKNWRLKVNWKNGLSDTFPSLTYTEACEIADTYDRKLRVDKTEVIRVD